MESCFKVVFTGTSASNSQQRAALFYVLGSGVVELLDFIRYSFSYIDYHWLHCT